ncbi:MAG: hypothetical protein PVG39_18545 [Desulfobacteraceae bacterium]|jgi:hypothetical protein
MNNNNQYIGSIYCSPGFSIFLGTLPVPKFHSYHHATLILVGNKKPVNVITENGKYTDNLNIEKDSRIVKAVNYIRNLEVKKASTKNYIFNKKQPVYS